MGDAIISRRQRKKARRVAEGGAKIDNYGYRNFLNIGR